MANSRKFIAFHNKENVTSSVANVLYNDSLENSGLTCDLIIKAGPEKLEFCCHRIILASASDFIWEALSTATPGTVPVLLLPDISSTVIQLVLFYVYNGHVEIPLSQYVDFVDACQLLQLKGPVENVETVVKQGDVVPDKDTSMIDLCDEQNLMEPEPGYIECKVEFNDSEVNYDGSVSSFQTFNGNYYQDETNIGYQLNTTNEAFEPNPSTSTTFTTSSKSRKPKKKCDLTNPSKPKAKAKTVTCDLCGHHLCDRSSLRKHKLFKHDIGGTRSFVCNICEKGFVQKADLMKHQKIHSRLES